MRRLNDGSVLDSVSQPLFPLHWLLASIAIIPLDYFTGPYLDGVVLFYPIPAAMAAWSGSRRWSFALAAALPPVRMLIFHYWGWLAKLSSCVPSRSRS